MMSVTELTIRRPDDWHAHLRDGDMLRAVAEWTARDFGRAIVMPNVVPPVTTTALADDYRRRVLDALPEGCDFTPLMTLYLTESTAPAEIDRAVASDFVKAVKLFPAGATTNSENGVRDMDRVMPVLERMAETGMVLSVHGEVTDPEVDVFDREAVYIDRVLDPLRRRLPELRIVMEHVTSARGVEYVLSAERNLAATITPHHLVLTRSHILSGGIHPHYYCLPVAKGPEDRRAVRRAAVSGDPRFFFGSDSAPHPDAAKLRPAGSAGIFNAPTALACVAAVFEEESSLEKLETFVALNGPAFYNLLASSSRITLRRSEQAVAFPDRIMTADGPVTVFDPGFPLHWRVVGRDGLDDSTF